MFNKKYVSLSGEIVTDFIGKVNERSEEFETCGINDLVTGQII